MSIDRNGPAGPQLAEALEVPFDANSPDGTIVQGDGLYQTVVLVGLSDGSTGRVSFETLDSIRLCRGEFPPYDFVAEEEGWPWLSTIQQSRWLYERCLYERKFYGGASGTDMDEMLCDYSHYVFRFEDEYIEAIAKGIWIDRVRRFQEPLQLPPDHPLGGKLPVTSKTRRFAAHGIDLSIRVNPKSTTELLDHARLCSQCLFQIGFADDVERWSPSWQLQLRYRDGRAISVFRHHLGRSEFEVDGVGTIDDILPYLEQDLARIKKRRGCR